MSNKQRAIYRMTFTHIHIRSFAIHSTHESVHTHTHYVRFSPVAIKSSKTLMFVDLTNEKKGKKKEFCSLEISSFFCFLFTPIYFYRFYFEFELFGQVLFAQYMLDIYV